MLINITPLSAITESGETLGDSGGNAAPTGITIGEFVELIENYTIDLSVSNPAASGAGWTFANNTYTILDGADLTVTGTNANKQRLAIVQGAAAAITLDDARITVVDDGYGVPAALLLLSLFIAVGYFVFVPVG